MDISHLHLHVRDRPAAIAFYERWFGLRVVDAGATITFMRGDRDFLLALMDDAAAAALPAWFHFGVGLESRDAVCAMHAAMQKASVPVVKAFFASPTLVSYRCGDRDGHTIEVYWQASR